MNKTIVIDAREALGTTGRYIRKLLENLQEIDTENKYKILLHPEAVKKIVLLAPNFSKVVVSQRKFSFAEQLTLGGTIRNLKPDLVHFTLPNQPALYRGKTVTTVHDLTPVRFINSADKPVVYRLKQSIFARLIKRVARKSTIVITPSNFVAEDLSSYSGVNLSKIVVTPESADLICAKAEPVQTLVGKQFIFFTGRAHPHKNLARLVEAFKTLSSAHPELLLVFGGKFANNYENLEKQAGSSQASGQIVFTDYLGEGQLRWLYENAQAYVLPSLSEGFGLPGLEAMVHGCPVVSSNATCLPEVYGGAARYFDPLDVDDMAQKIAEVLDDGKLRGELIKKGHAQAAKYSWKHMAEQTLKVYKKVLS